MGKHDRFEIVYTQGIADITRILLDTHTGVLYLQMIQANAGGLTPLLDRDGKPMQWLPEREDA